MHITKTWKVEMQRLIEQDQFQLYVVICALLSHSIQVCMDKKTDF